MLALLPPSEAIELMEANEVRDSIPGMCVPFFCHEERILVAEQARAGPSTPSPARRAAPMPDCWSNFDCILCVRVRVFGCTYSSGSTHQGCGPKYLTNYLCNCRLQSYACV